MKKNYLSLFLLFMALIFVVISGYYFRYPIRFMQIFKAPDPAPAQTADSPAVIKPNTTAADTLTDYIRHFNPKLYERLAREIVDSAIDSGRESNISPIMIVGVMQIESEFNINAISKKEARGLMQINLSVWSKDLIEKGIMKDPEEIHDPRINVRAGCYILRKYLDETKDFEKALYKYLGADVKDYKDAINKAIGNILLYGFSKDANAAFCF
jgi:soluble lytic murein transglycosylase-like protein